MQRSRIHGPALPAIVEQNMIPLEASINMEIMDLRIVNLALLSADHPHIQGSSTLMTAMQRDGNRLVWMGFSAFGLLPYGMQACQQTSQRCARILIATVLECNIFLLASISIFSWISRFLDFRIFFTHMGFGLGVCCQRTS